MQAAERHSRRGIANKVAIIALLDRHGKDGVSQVRNRCELFCRLLKRAIKGTYVDEQTYRFNNRTGDDAARFALALKGIIGKRLTYAALTGSELPQTC